MNLANTEVDDVISKMRFGHIGLNSMLEIITKHVAGISEYCGQMEIGENILLDCNKYSNETDVLNFTAIKVD